MSKHRLELLCGIALIISSAASAKCPTGIVTVRGRVDNLSSAPLAPVVDVVLETPKGNVSKTASICDGVFSVEVPFSTFSASSLGGDRCNNIPTAVRLRLEVVGDVYIERRFQFKDSFEMYRPFLYRPKKDLSIDVAKDAR